MKEDKFDRLIRKTINDGYMQSPSPQFTEHIMEKLGVTGQESKLKTKPIKAKWGIWSMVVIYILLIAFIFIIPGSIESSSFQLPEFELPSLSKYFSFSGNISKLLIVLILGGWILIFLDNYVKRYFTR